MGTVQAVALLAFSTGMRASAAIRVYRGLEFVRQLLANPKLIIMSGLGFWTRPPCTEGANMSTNVFLLKSIFCSDKETLAFVLISLHTYKPISLPFTPTIPPPAAAITTTTSTTARGY